MKPPYAIEQRLRFIDFLLFHYGDVGHKQLIDFFGTTETAVRLDFTQYMKMFPGNVERNKATKRWQRLETFTRGYT